MEDETFIQKRITNDDIYKEQLRQGKVLGETLAHAKITNGRVTELEKRSLGVWIKIHPIKFAMFVVIFTGIVISDIRHPIVDLLTKFI